MSCDRTSGPGCGRTACMIVVLGAFLVVTSVLAGIVTIGHHSFAAALGAFVLSLCLNILLFVVAFRVLTPRQIPWGDIIPGSDSPAGPAGRFCSTSAVFWSRDFSTEHQQGVRNFRARTRLACLPLLGRGSHRLRGRDERREGATSLAPRHCPTTADGCGPRGPFFACSQESGVPSSIWRRIPRTRGRKGSHRASTQDPEASTQH